MKDLLDPEGMHWILMKYIREYLDKYQLPLVIIWNRTKPKQWTISYVT